MGPNMKQKKCLACGTSIEKMSVGGDQVFFCPLSKVPSMKDVAFNVGVRIKHHTR